MTDHGHNLRHPRTRGECPPPSQPCPFVTCRFHLWLDRELDRHGAVVDFHETAAWGDEQHTCVLRQAEHGGCTLDQIARMFGLTRERIRQIEAAAIEQCRRNATPALRELADAPAEEDETTDDTGHPEWGERDETDAPEPGGSDSTSPPSDARLAQWRAQSERRRRALAEAAEASPLVPCPGCGRLMHSLTRTGKRREVCGTSCAHRFPSPPPPRMGPGTGPAGDAGDDGPGFPLATGEKRRSHCSHGGSAAQATAP